MGYQEKSSWKSIEIKSNFLIGVETTKKIRLIVFYFFYKSLTYFIRLENRFKLKSI